MSESRLTPFDAEVFLMIKSITDSEPEVKEADIFFTIKMYAPHKDEKIIEAAIYAVKGRYGKRIKDIRLIKEHALLNGSIFYVEYEKGAENLPNEIRSELKEPNENAGYLYLRKLMEVRAVPVSRDNLERLNEFTGGGIIRIPRNPGGVAVYSFPTENGLMLDVPERYYIVLTPDGKFGKIDAPTFIANFEGKDDNAAVLDFAEKRLFEKMNKLFGRNFQCRFSKLTEEYNDLFVAADDMLVNGIMPEDTSEIIDGLADLNAVLFHIAALFGYSQRELQEMAYKKITGREKNPDFMRKHPHEKPESPVCGNCSNFENEDIEGDGFCNEQNRMRHCSCLACYKWQEKSMPSEYNHFMERYTKKE